MHKSKHILIVDDDAELTQGVQWRLEAEGYATSTACDGEEGLDRAIREQPDAILMDVRMPKADGMTTLQRLRLDGRTQHTPVIMLSASLADEQSALDAGARYFLRKPYTHAQLFSAIKLVTSGGVYPN